MSRQKNARKPGRTVLEKRRVKHEKRAERVVKSRKRDAIGTAG